MLLNENKCSSFHHQCYSSHSVAPLRPQCPFHTEHRSGNATSTSTTTSDIQIQIHPCMNLSATICYASSYCICQCIIFDPLLTCFQSKCWFAREQEREKIIPINIIQCASTCVCVCEPVLSVEWSMYSTNACRVYVKIYDNRGLNNENIRQTTVATRTTTMTTMSTTPPPPPTTTTI